MQYRKGVPGIADLSLLGLGCMRLPSKAGRIDQAKSEEVMQAALDAGINYFDTAYVYPGSEACVGQFLAKGHRDEVVLATKVPHYMCKKADDFERIFQEQLTRLQTDHVDYYLMHMLTSLTSWERAVELGAVDFVERHKADGSIRAIGFSFHGGVGEFKRVLDAYPWEFCQIQLNYLDAHSQAGLEGLQYAAAKGIPVIIMEPLRGGRLADKLPSAAKRICDEAQPKQSPASWGFSWLYDLPDVTCVLSGMNEIAQVQENAAVADAVTAGSLTDAQRSVYDHVVAAIARDEKVPCTGCGYCMPCPQGVDIPTCFRAYNIKASEGWFEGLKTYIMTTSLREHPTNASRCIKCGKCERHCPQSIAIREELQNVTKALEGPAYKIVAKFKGVAFKV